jgi:hypothetical protein
MWIFTKAGFIGLAQHPQQDDKLLWQAQSQDEIESMVGLLDEIGGTKHEVEQATDGFARFAVVTAKNIAAQAVARLLAQIDYSHFTQAVNFDFGSDPQFLLWTKPTGLQVARIKPY